MPPVNVDEHGHEEKNSALYSGVVIYGSKMTWWHVKPLEVLKNDDGTEEK